MTQSSHLHANDLPITVMGGGEGGRRKEETGADVKELGRAKEGGNRIKVGKLWNRRRLR